ncbi:uroporphyrin-III C-methyltransferase [Ophidiomyces ophidiicola]|uniref:Uroporphyrin-III C-methyltransferase n=1 Tax=Ophidiomyces ophidiicola TaxID=1387563 RepID=A0ACB8UVZ8_9EURO|nr:uroporphyrin-III C-methyltransferase [Ophidiomyces ophidiicola]KAI1924071.1 uroporphyrin-III C-methyltransferase [Ophidiomyces ophidiicola]KAI1925053.1 uroporphyrin-III C-methyltransferase [Ophidiomyces ophidiicola]KAI2010650.1 uroporphyrin-III C-methyltransferase [Ophidiomyces ophidiicola]KAI2016014.1 uroporphyrin-III C-methyltransferase [Ophidiomyces ophidiicola]
MTLLAALDVADQVHLIIGADALALSRCAKSLAAGARPVVVAPGDATLPTPPLLEHADVTWLQREFCDADLWTLGRSTVDHYVDAVFVARPGDARNAHVAQLCRRWRIPVNVTDAPDLCSFTLLSTYSDGPLHIGITTSGRGCKLASRLQREIAAYLPPGLGNAIEVLGNVRNQLYREDVPTVDAGSSSSSPPATLPFESDDDDTTAQKPTFNSLVLAEDPTAAKTRRIRWLSQICEYWPLRQLASVTNTDVDRILTAYKAAKSNLPPPSDAVRKHGTIILAGAGPGHPDLLTRATCHAIASADLILSDKLVPAPVLDLVPRRTELRIARKFPGNADKAQDELLEMALSGLHAGKKVLRLKQGDPYLYGRGAEEYEFFQARGYRPIVLPGITSALSAPLFAGVSSTHRGVADQVLICTGTGRHGKAPDPPTYIPTQTVVFLMALHRISSLVEALTTPSDSNTSVHRHPWPIDMPCAVVERASCADQRVIRSTLEHVCAAVEAEGSRPPGLLVVGKSCEILHRINQKWVVEDGFRGLENIRDSGMAGVINALCPESEA